jgi:hypothetical protein
MSALVAVTASASAVTEQVDEAGLVPEVTVASSTTDEMAMFEGSTHCTFSGCPRPASAGALPVTSLNTTGGEIAAGGGFGVPPPLEPPPPPPPQPASNVSAASAAHPSRFISIKGAPDAFETNERRRNVAHYPLGVQVPHISSGAAGADRANPTMSTGLAGRGCSG